MVSLRLFMLLGLIAITGTVAGTDQWPQWRGPAGNGISQAVKVPASWTATENMLWSVPLPGMGGATPVLWENKLYVVSENKDRTSSLLCIDADTGKSIWEKPVSTKKGSRARGDEGNSVSASPSTNGKHIYVFVGTGEFTCFDMNGNVVWQFDAQERYGKFNIQFGISSTPVLHQDKLYWQLIHTDGQFVICLNAADGKDVWKVQRPSDGHTENEHSYASAVMWNKGDNAYLVVHGNDYTTAHDLKDGREIWRLGGLNPKEKYNPYLRFVASPACSEDLIVVPTAKNGPVVGLKPGAQGNVGPGSPYEQWRRTRETPDVPSPLIHEGLVYLCRENGVLICIDAETGKEYYNQRIHSARYRASPVFADGKIFCTARDGTVTVTKAGKTFESLSVNKLSDQISASPVIANGKIYLRGYEKLYCIGNKQ